MKTLNITNPVYPNYFADPFVLLHNGSYFAYGTEEKQTQLGRAFSVLHSTDLVRWTSLESALDRLDNPAITDYWAPEVTFYQGRFYLYYSAGIGDKGHQLRVAISEQPSGPFCDQGVILSNDSFAIDPHPFCDDDGQYYLFYARDFLEGERVGTALVVDLMLGMTALAGQARTVLRASADWQLYEAARPMYGGIYDWYTLEGPFVVKRQGRYYLFYSGGAWQKPNYGVSYAVADHPLGPWYEPVADKPTILQSTPKQMLGPGHNSIISGPDGHDYVVYHAWDKNYTARRMHIDRLTWVAHDSHTYKPRLSSSFSAS